MGYWIILLSSLGAPLLYAICKSLFHHRQAAFYAFVLYALIPGKIFFFPILNTLTPVFILLCLYLLLRYIESKKNLFLVFLGVAFYILILFEPSPLVTGLIFVGILYNAFREKRVTAGHFRAVITIPLLAFFAVYLLFWVFLSFNLFQTFQFILKDAVNFNAVDQRGYWIWLKENLKEFFYAGGLPVMMIFIYMTIQMITQGGSLGTRKSDWSIEKIYIFCLFATVSIVEFLGINRGEITRLWIYLAVFFQVPAAFFIAKKPGRNALFYFVASTLVVQTVITLQRVAFIMP
jgi:hypothetical protein